MRIPETKRSAQNLLLSLSLFFTGCNLVSTTDNNLANDVDDLRLLSTDIEGWSSRAEGDFDGWGSYIGDAVLGDSPINGAAAPYVDLGSLKFGLQYLETQSDPPLILHAYLMDFGTEDNARIAFDEFKPASGGLPVPGFAASVALIDDASVPFGCIAHAYFGKFYIELRLNNYNPKSLSYEDAAIFLAVYRKKIRG